MKVKSKLITIMLIIVTTAGLSQSFSPAFDRFSGSKTAYLNLEDGSKIEGTIEDFDRKKGLIEEVTIKETANGKKIKLTPDKIKNMYIPPSNVAKLAEASDYLTEVSRWESDASLDKDILGKGYAYFEKVQMKVGKKVMPIIAQLMNPAFNAKIKVYQDPLARETTGIGFAGVDVVGGDDKSYYVQVGSEIGFRLFKKNYDEEFARMFKDCPSFSEKIKNPTWSDLEKNIYDYTKECK